MNWRDQIEWPCSFFHKQRHIMRLIKSKTRGMCRHSKRSGDFCILYCTAPPFSNSIGCASTPSAHSVFCWGWWTGEQVSAHQSWPGSKLTAWFESNSKYRGARGIKKSDYPCYLTWNKSNKEWTPRTLLRVKRTFARRKGNPGPSTETVNFQSGQSKYIFNRPEAKVTGRIYKYVLGKARAFIYGRFRLTFQVLYASEIKGLWREEYLVPSVNRAVCLDYFAFDSKWRRVHFVAFTSSLFLSLMFLLQLWLIVSLPTL